METKDGVTSERVMLGLGFRVRFEVRVVTLLPFSSGILWHFVQWKLVQESYCLMYNVYIRDYTHSQVLMMHQMLIDLVFFILLVAMFLVGYGVSSAALMNPNKYETLTTTLVYNMCLVY